MKRKRMKGIVSLLLIGCMLLSGCSKSRTPETGISAENSEEETTSVSENYIDTLSPANDFYGYINANDIMQMELKSNQERISTLGLIGEETDEQVEAIIKEIADSEEEFPKGSNEQMIHDMYWLTYKALSDKQSNEASDTAFVEEIIDKINAVEDKEDLLNLWHDLAKDYGLSTFLMASVDSNLYDTSEKVISFDFYPLADMAEIKDSDIKGVSYRDNFESYLKLCDITSDEAKDRATDVIYLYYDLAGCADPLILSGDKKYYEMYHLYSKEECEKNLKNLSYEQLLYSVGYDGKLPDKIAISDPGLFWEIDRLVDEEHVQAWKDIALIHFLSGNSYLLPTKYTFEGLEGLSPEKRTIRLISKYFQSEISDIYAEKYFTEKDKEIITKMCNDMVAEYRVLIEDADWLSGEGKSYLIEKLDNMKFFIGCGEKREDRPEEADLIRDTLLQTMYSFTAYQMNKSFDELFQKNVYNGFDDMSPITVNACYLPSENSIVITAAIINKRVFDSDADYAWNLGAIGSIIGHEISHAFDSNGVLFDAHGNYSPDAMPKADMEAFKQKQETAIEYYNTFTVLGSHVNGKLTLPENFADISGLQCVLSIAGDKDSQKTAFESYAHTWCSLITDITAKTLLETDVHSPANVRVNAVVACFDEFYEIYGVKEGDPMYIEPEKRVRRW